MKSNKPKRDHSAIATQYAHDVVDGAIPACRYVKLACQRHLDDLANDSATWLYAFNTKKANRVCKIIELLPLVKGSKFFGKNLILEPWLLHRLQSVRMGEEGHREASLQEGLHRGSQGER